MNCTIHTAKKLIPTKTKFGVRYGCPVGGCTVVAWNGATSTPADYGTRQARIQAHDKFDKLWKMGIFTRHEAYKKLAQFLKLPIKTVHIGHFDKQQCYQVIDFCNGILEVK